MLPPLLNTTTKAPVFCPDPPPRGDRVADQFLEDLLVEVGGALEI
jgi:hypothetical protein